MSEPEQGQDKPPEKAPDAPGRADALALGIGCLVTLIMLGAAIFVGMSRG